MSSNVVATLATLVLLASVLFLLFGPLVIKRMPPVRQLYDSKEKLRRVRISKPPSAGTDLRRFSRMQLEEICLAAPAEHRTKIVSQALQIVDYRDRILRRIVQELRAYAFLLLVLALVGTLHELQAEGFAVSAIWKSLGAHPFSVLAIVELVMVIFFTVRLGVELHEISELLQDDD